MHPSPSARSTGCRGTTAVTGSRSPGCGCCRRWSRQPAGKWRQRVSVRVSHDVQYFRPRTKRRVTVRAVGRPRDGRCPLARADRPTRSPSTGAHPAPARRPDAPEVSSPGCRKRRMTGSATRFVTTTQQRISPASIWRRRTSAGSSAGRSRSGTSSGDPVRQHAARGAGHPRTGGQPLVFPHRPRLRRPHDRPARCQKPTLAWPARPDAYSTARRRLPRSHLAAFAPSTGVPRPARTRPGTDPRRDADPRARPRRQPARCSCR